MNIRLRGFLQVKRRKIPPVHGPDGLLSYFPVILYNICSPTIPQGGTMRFVDDLPVYLTIN